MIPTFQGRLKILKNRERQRGIETYSHTHTGVVELGTRIKEESRMASVSKHPKKLPFSLVGHCLPHPASSPLNLSSYLSDAFLCGRAQSTSSLSLVPYYSRDSTVLRFVRPPLALPPSFGIVSPSSLQLFPFYICSISPRPMALYSKYSPHTPGYSDRC